MLGPNDLTRAKPYRSKRPRSGQRQLLVVAARVQIKPVGKQTKLHLSCDDDTDMVYRSESLASAYQAERWAALGLGI